MGLDGVELVMEFEDEFGLEIADEDAEAMRTPADVIDHLMARLPHILARDCVTQKCFYRTRRSLVTMLGLERGILRPETRLEDIAPEEDRRTWWAALGERLRNQSWPGLVRPGWVLRIGCLLALGAGVVAGLATYFLVSAAVPWTWLTILLTTIGTLAGIVGAALGFGLITTPLKVCFPDGADTVGGLSRTLVAGVEPPDGKWTRELVSVRVKAIVQNQLGLSDKAYDENGRFVEDFGLA